MTYLKNFSRSFYDINEKFYRSQRTCSFGKGKRSDFTLHFKDSPSPNTYFPLNLTITKDLNKGFSFGLGR